MPYVENREKFGEGELEMAYNVADEESRRGNKVPAMFRHDDGGWIS